MLVIETFYNRSTVHCLACGGNTEYLGDDLPIFCEHCRAVLPDAVDIARSISARVVHHLDEETF